LSAAPLGEAVRRRSADGDSGQPRLVGRTSGAPQRSTNWPFTMTASARSAQASQPASKLASALRGMW
jgi:hypothetical protein